MNVALVMLLALIWGVVLIPSAVRNHRSNVHNSIGGFNKAMNVLAAQPMATRRLLVPHDARRIVDRAAARRQRMVERRRRWLFGLGATTLVGLVGSTLVGGWITTLTVLSAAALAAYVTALRQAEVARQQRDRVVALSGQRHDEEPVAQRRELARAVGDR